MAVTIRTMDDARVAVARHLATSLQTATFENITGLRSTGLSSAERARVFRARDEVIALLSKHAGLAAGRLTRKENRGDETLVP